MKDMSQKKGEECWLQVRGHRASSWMELKEEVGGSLRENISPSPAAFFLTHSDISETCQIRRGQVWEPKRCPQIRAECSVCVSCCSRCRADPWAGAGWMRMMKQG